MDIFESLENLNVSEECFEDIIGIVEEILNERNKENRESRRNWELTRGYKTPEYTTSKDNVLKGEEAIKDLKAEAGKRPRYFVQQAVDAIARGNRVALGREQDPVSYTEPDEWYKTYGQRFNKEKGKEYRKEQSQRGSIKDPYIRTSDELTTKQADMQREK